jgi:pyruvate dehydrogenase E1 component
VPWVTEALGGSDAPVVAVSDFQKAVPLLIAPWVPAPYRVLGTDGFGRSDVRPALRRLFRIDAEHVAVAALHELARQGAAEAKTVAEAIARYGLDTEHTTEVP